MRHHTICVELNAYSRATKAKNGQHKKIWTCSQAGNTQVLILAPGT
jgi:hypothetical protein